MDVVPESQGELDEGIGSEINKNIAYPSELNSMCILLRRNEDSGRAYWEIGYQLLTVLIQVKALDISYQAEVFNERQINKLESLDIQKPVGVVHL